MEPQKGRVEKPTLLLPAFHLIHRPREREREYEESCVCVCVCLFPALLSLFLLALPFSIKHTLSEPFSLSLSLSGNQHQKRSLLLLALLLLLLLLLASSIAAATKSHSYVVSHCDIYKAGATKKPAQWQKKEGKKRKDDLGREGAISFSQILALSLGHQGLLAVFAVPVVHTHTHTHTHTIFLCQIIFSTANLD